MSLPSAVLVIDLGYAADGGNGAGYLVLIGLGEGRPAEGVVDAPGVLLAANDCSPRPNDSTVLPRPSIDSRRPFRDTENP